MLLLSYMSKCSTVFSTAAAPGNVLIVVLALCPNVHVYIEPTAAAESGKQGRWGWLTG